MSIPYEQEFELYHYGDSIASQIARISLAEKGVPYKSHHVHLEGNGEHLEPAYRRINPKALVPTLVQNGTPHYDSYKIMRYLDDLFPERGPKLWPADPEVARQVDLLVADYSFDNDVDIGGNFGWSIGGASIRILFYLLTQRPWWEVVKQYAGHPMRARGMKVVVGRTLRLIPPPLIKKSMNQLARGLVDVERRLEHGGDYLFGDDFSAPDLMLSVHFSRLIEVALGDVLSSDELPRVAQYWQRLQQRPSFNAAIADWHKSDWYDAIDAVYGGKPSQDLPLLQESIQQQLNNH